MCLAILILALTTSVFSPACFLEAAASSHYTDIENTQFAMSQTANML